MEEINQKDLEKFRKLGLIDEIALRNYYIKRDFEELRNKGNKVTDCLRVISQKYYLSESSINIIIYSRVSRTKINDFGQSYAR